MSRGIGRAARSVFARLARAAFPASASARQRATLLASILGLSVTILDETIVFVALPAIERDLHLGLNGQQWIVNGYLLTLSAFLLIGGALGDAFGRRRVFLYGLIGFGFASLACAAAPSGSILIAFRLLQGLAAAMLMPSTLALLISCFEGPERGAAIGSWSAWGAVAAAIGPLVGGVLIQAFSWRAIFLLSPPLVAVAIVITLLAVDESRDEHADARHLDYAGAILAALALGGLAFGLVQGPARGWGGARVLAALGLSVVSTLGFLARECRAPAPMLPLHLFRVRNFTAANAATLALYGVFNGNFFILVIYLQTALGYSPLAAGAASVPLTLMMIALASRLARLTAPLGPRRPMTLGLLLTAGGLAVLATLAPGESYWLHVLPGVVLFGLGLAFAVPPLTDAAVSAVSESRSGLASAVNDAVARTAALLAVALLGLVFAVSFRAQLNPPPGTNQTRAHVLELARARPTAALEPSVADAAAPSLRATLSTATVDAYRVAMGFGVAIALAGALLAYLSVQDPPGRPRLRDWAGARRRHPEAPSAGSR